MTPPRRPRRNLKRRKRPSAARRLLRSAGHLFFLLTIFVTTMAVISGYLVLRKFIQYAQHEVSLDAITHLTPPDNTVVLDRDGKKIGEYFDNYHVFVPFDKIPDLMKSAIVSIEDRNFWTHPGYDLHAILRAGWVYVKHRRIEQGGSTLTQQLVRHFLLSPEKSINRKLLEILLAAKLEKKLSKRRIFELYANELFLGNGAYGVGAASLRYFGKPVSKLNLSEVALIAGLFQSPSAYNPEKSPDRAKDRQREVLEAMVETGAITVKQANEALNRPLRFVKYEPSSEQTAPYFIDYIETSADDRLPHNFPLRNGGLRIHTTLDSTLQEFARESVQEVGPKLDDAVRNGMRGRWRGLPVPKIEAALLALDPRTGDVLAMVGGRDYRGSQFNRVTSSVRSPGSAFKPVIYSLALERGWKWSDVVYVDPITIRNYRPRNFENEFLTETTLERAFYRSMNTPTVELGLRLGIDSILRHAKRLGIRTELKPEAGTILGGSAVTMWDMARLYSAFANLGTLVEPFAITHIDDRNGQEIFKAPTLESRTTQDVVSPRIAYLMVEGMRAVLERGTAYEGHEYASIAAGKTGTTNDSTDNWFCGISPGLVTIVWVGTDDHTPLPPVADGASMALPIWEAFMSKVTGVREFQPFERPRGVVAAQVHPLYGYRVSRGGVRMYFLRGKLPSRTPSALEVVNRDKSYRSLFQEK